MIFSSSVSGPEKQKDIYNSPRYSISFRYKFDSLHGGGIPQHQVHNNGLISHAMMIDSFGVLGIYSREGNLVQYQKLRKKIIYSGRLKISKR